jgi:hypothetical protein
MSEHLRAAVIVMMTIVVVFLAIFVTAWLLKGQDPEIQLPLLVIGGLVALLGMLAVMAVAFKTVDLADPKQALGLPDGTVRAVIALSLILIFAVVTVYLFSNLSREADEACAANVNDLQRQILSTKAATPPSNATPTGTETQGPAPAPPPVPTSPTSQRVANHAAAQDFAKQLLIMLGTLITSITSFYFASKTVSDAAALVPKTAASTPTPPTATDVHPRQIPRNGTERARIEVNGAGMLTVNTVLFRKSGYEIAARDVLSGPSTVRFVVPDDIAPGQWDIVLKTIDGAETIVHPGIEVL